MTGNVADHCLACLHASVILGFGCSMVSVIILLLTVFHYPYLRFMERGHQGHVEVINLQEHGKERLICGVELDSPCSPLKVNRFSEDSVAVIFRVEE
jgi:hypothetical protein